MDSRAAERLIRSLSFDVEAIPQQDNALKAPANQAPMNLKIRVRKKEGMVLQKNTVLTIPNMSHPERAPERVRLASSDTTIMSFDVLMETDSEKRPAKKHRRLFGGCFGTQSDDEETPYKPSSTKNNSKSDTNLTFLKGQSNEIEKPVFTESKNTTFFGKCKPGGCLDPPFGEDRYKYQPKLTTTAKDSSKELKITSSTHKITNKRLSKDRPSQDSTTPERGRIRNKSDSTEKDSTNIKYKINSRQTSKSSLIGAKIIENVVGSKTIILKELRKSNIDLDTARGSGRSRRSSRDGSPEMYSQTKRDSRYQVLEPIVKRGRDNSIERESKTKNDISEHMTERSSRDNSPGRSNPMHEKSQHPQQIPDSRTQTYEQHKLLGNYNTATADTRKQVKRESKDHGQEPRGLTQMYSPDPDKYYKRGSRDRIMERQIQVSSREPSPEPKGLTPTNSRETYKGRGSRDRIPDINTRVKQSSREHIPESTGLTPNKCIDSRDSILEMDRRVKLIRREDSLEPKGITQMNSYYRRDSRDCISRIDRQVKQSSRERSPESETSMKNINIDHIPVFEDGKTGIIQEKETQYLKAVESERSENTKVEFTKENSNMTTRKMSSNPLAKGVDQLDNTRSDALKERGSYTTKQKQPNKRGSKEISGDVSNIVDDTDSIITYPPATSCSELKFEEKKMEKRNTSKRNSISNSISSSRARSSVNEFTNKYFSPPKKDNYISYASILNPSQDNAFIDPAGEQETTHAKTDTMSENPPKEKNLRSVDVLIVEKTQPNETSVKKSPYAVSKDSNIRDDINISMPKGRMSIDTLDSKQEININSHYKQPIQVRSDLDDETQDYPFISRSEIYEDEVADDTQQNATVPGSSDEMDRNRADDQLTENGIVYQQSQNLAKISKSKVQTYNKTNYETKHTEKDGNSEFDDENNPIFNKMSENQINKDSVAIHGRDSTTGMNKEEPYLAQDCLSYEQFTIRNAIAPGNKDSALFRTLNDAEKASFQNNFNENDYMGNTFQDPKSDFNETPVRYSSIGNNEDVNVQDKNAEYYVEDTNRKYDLYDEEEKSIKNVNGDRINDSFVQVEANEYVKSNNYLRLEDEMNGKEPDDQSYRPPYFKEDDYYVPATDVENKSPYFKEDDHHVSATVPENKSPSDYQNSVDINSFRTLDEAVKADSNDTRSKSYHSGDSRLPVKEEFTQLHAKQLRESSDAGIKSQDWQDIIRKEEIDLIRAATPPRTFMRDSVKVGGNEFYAENEQQGAKETKRETQPVEYYDDNQSHSGSGKQIDSIFLELAIQTHVKSEDAILKTSDLSSGSRTRIIKAVLNAQNEKVRIPIDDQNELSIQYKKVIPGSTASSQRIQFLLPRTQSQSRQESQVMGSMHTTNMKDDRRGDVKGTALYPNPLVSLERFGSDLRETLSFVYENQLVPLQNTIKSLKEDIDFLASQQLLLRDRIHGTSSSRRIRPVRLIHSSKRCVCIGNPRY